MQDAGTVENYTLTINYLQSRHYKKQPVPILHRESHLRTMPINTPITFVTDNPPALLWVNLYRGRGTYQKLYVDHQQLTITSL
jgi:hypothetical protein